MLLVIETKERIAVIPLILLVVDPKGFETSTW